jgi:opacity protein-like surface antigen
MKRFIIGAFLALPLAVTALAAQANAAEVSVQSGHWNTNQHGRVGEVNRPEVQIAFNRSRRVWVSGHWAYERHHRVWVPGHYEYR